MSNNNTEETDDKPFKYVDNSPSVPEDVANRMIEMVRDNELKPWTVVARIEEEFDIEDARMDVLKPLVLEGVLTPNADGDLRVMDETRLDNIVQSS